MESLDPDKGTCFIPNSCLARQQWHNTDTVLQNHKRRLPFLIPAADFTERELIDLKLQGTCEVQICRSVGPWSMGTLTKIEHSIQNAYVKCESNAAPSLHIYIVSRRVIHYLPILGQFRSIEFHSFHIHEADPANSDRVVGTLPIHRKPVLHILDRRRRRSHSKQYRRRHCRASHPSTQGRDEMESVYRHSALTGLHVPNR